MISKLGMTGVKTRRIAAIAIFAVLSMAVDSIITPGFSAGVWYGWIFIISPITGILLGPRDGFIATLIAVMVGHTVVFRETVFEFIFTLGAPICSLIAGLIYQNRWKTALGFYSLFIVSYFLTPISCSLPLCGIWDCILSYTVLLTLTLMRTLGYLNFHHKPVYLFALSAFIGLEADVLFRIFVLVPLQL